MSRAKKVVKRRKTTKNKTSGIRDKRYPKVFAVLLCLLACYLFLAFISYLFSWKIDQDKMLHADWNILFQKDLIVQNWLGKFGAYISHQFFYNGFGLSSFITVYITIKLAYVMFFQKGLRYLGNPILHTLSFLFIVSPLFAFVLSSQPFPWGGRFGHFSSIWLVSILGNLGTALLFIFVGIAFMVWNFHHRIQESLFTFTFPQFAFAGASKASGTSNQIDLDLEERKNGETGTDLEPVEHSKKPYTPLLEESLGESLDITPITKEVAEKEKESKEKKEEKLELELDEQFEKALVTPKTDKELEIKEVVERATPAMFIEKEDADSMEPYDPTLELSDYQCPDLELLENYESEIVVNREELEQNKDQIVNTLRHYKIEITRIRATVGPTITLYEIVPAPGIRISKIKNLEDDIALSLAALGIRIIAPIPGKGTIGIEVPNRHKETVGLKEILQSEKFQKAKMDLPIALGKTISNEVFIADLAKMPHLLVAGATGQGKSVGINTILTSLLYKKHPSQLKLVLVDPKKVELFPYNDLNHHFLAMLPDHEEGIITENKNVVATLHSLCIEMDHRYDLLKKAHARNIKEYNRKFIKRKLNPLKGHTFLPYIVLVIDEFADLIMTAGKEVELSIARLAQLARAVGIHLIIATQRPSVNIITGVIKANFPARIAYRVASKVDSRTILDAGGADQLIGSGDMLLNVGGDMIRLQCAFVDTPEVERIIQFISNQNGYPEPFYLPEYVSDEDVELGQGTGLTKADLDDCFEDAARLVVNNQLGSTSMIQRRLKLGYNRAGRIMDQLEALGIVGPNEGSKAREVLINSEIELQTHLDQISDL